MATEVTALEMPQKRTLGEILEAFQALDDLADDQGDDPAILVGDLHDKVDSIDYVVKALTAYSDHQKKLADVHLRRALAARKRTEWLLDYVKREMEAKGFEKLPGVGCELVLAKASNPATVVTRQPDERDAVARPDLVRLVPKRYEWDLVAVKDALKDGESIEFARLEYKNSVKIKAKNALPEKAKK